MDSSPPASQNRAWTELARTACQSLLHYSRDLSRCACAKRILRSVQGFAEGVRWTVLGPKVWRRRKCVRKLPLPLPSPWPPSTMKGFAASEKVIDVFEEVSDRLICILDDVHKNLQFWKARAEGADGPKVRFMVLERGPCAFFQAAAKLLRDCIWEFSPTRGLVVSAISRISERVMMLSTLQCRLATVLGEVYTEADRFGESALKGQVQDATFLALVSVHQAIITLEGLYDLPQSDYNISEAGGVVRTALYVKLHFKDLPEDLQQKKDWTDAEITLCANLILENVKHLEDCLSILMQKYRRPRRATRLWLRYTGGAVGLALVSGWLIQHSRLVGSNDLEVWLKQGAEAIAAFTKEHVERPLLSIRDDLFETFRRRHHGAAELEDVQLTADSLHRMLRAFAEQSNGQVVSNSATEQEMMEIVMNRYEKEITHPLQNLLGGELFRAMLIQVQKLKLDIETAMLELNQILRANEINFAVLAALPAFLFALILVWLLRISLLQSKGADGRGRASRLLRRMLLAEVEKTILVHQILIDQGWDGEMSWHYGMIIYLLDRFYKAVERHAVASNEWSSLRGDILDLAKPRVGLFHKLAITARMERIYDCIIPARPS